MQSERSQESLNITASKKERERNDFYCKKPGADIITCGVLR